MQVANINIKEIHSYYQLRMKPTAFLNQGRRTFISLTDSKSVIGQVGNIVKSVYRPGIFKRIFVSNLEYGKKYITASSMMSQDALLFSKILSVKWTDNLDPMILHPQMILVSCAGTIGQTRLIGEDLEGVVGSQDIIRVIPKAENYGFVYAYLSAPTINSYLLSLLYGSVVPRIEPEVIYNLPLADIPEEAQKEIHRIISKAYSLRNQASALLSEASEDLKRETGLKPLSPDDYDYFGARSYERQPSCYSRNIKEVGTVSINAFNHSECIEHIKMSIPVECKRLKDVIEHGDVFSTGSFPRVEIKGKNGIKLINQSDIFDTQINGKLISKRNVKLSNLVKYGEIIIAGVGTLGENETFCRSIFANEDLDGQLISGEFIRMNASDIPAGYLYTWLNSDYGFRLIRSTQAGTKLCRPIPQLLLDIPVPIVGFEKMMAIDAKVKQAFTNRHVANMEESKAISMVETELEKLIRKTQN